MGWARPRALLAMAVLAGAVTIAAAGCDNSNSGFGTVDVFVTNADIGPVEIDEVDSFGNVTVLGDLLPGDSQDLSLCDCDTGNTLEAIDPNGNLISDDVVVDGESWVIP